jgi:hypothetical protein
MTDTQALLNRLRRLGPDAIRARIAELDAEEKALRLLLRAAIRATANKQQEAAQ